MNDDDGTSAWMAASWKTRQNGALQPEVGGVKTALMKRNLSSVEGGRLGITPEWDDIQVCLITS